VARWTDVANCRFEITFTATTEVPVEACARIGPWPLLAVVQGSLRNGVSTEEAELVPAAWARGKYMSERLGGADPLLGVRAGRGVVDLRVFPVRKHIPVTVVIEGYVLAEAPAPERLRLYRTGERYLAVAPLEHDPHVRDATYHDERGGRALHFVGRTECLEKFGTDAADDVPFVLALETAAMCRGLHAVSDDMALAVLRTSGSVADLGPAVATPVWRRTLRRYRRGF
jgi:hypothetical protein